MGRDLEDVPSPGSLWPGADEGGEYTVCDIIVNTADNLWLTRFGELSVPTTAQLVAVALCSRAKTPLSAADAYTHQLT